MLEKLIENWLDSATERTYQPVFCQILLNEGYTVIHSTRHHPIEFGKDVIAVAPDGAVHAYQLKGSPNSRLNLTQYREMQPQLAELVNHQIDIPNLPQLATHKSFLVTNGEIEEDVQLAIQQFNAGNERDGYPNRKIETITRGTLLAGAKKLDISLWPSELDNTKILLEIMTEDGSDLFPLEKFHKLLSDVLILKDSQSRLNSAEFDRRSKSASLLTAICLSTFAEKKNHWAVICAWTMFALYLIASSIKYGHMSGLDEQLLIAEDVILNEMQALFVEVLERPEFLAEGDPLSDFTAYPWRKTLLSAIGSIFWLWSNKENIWSDQNFKIKLEEFLSANNGQLDIWGDAAFPQALLHLWALELIQSTNYTDTLKGFIQFSLDTSLPAIYNGIEEVIEHRLSESLEDFKSSIELEEKVSTSWFVRQLLLHAAFRGEKATCQDVWKTYSKVSSAYFLPKYNWQYCLVKSENGNNMQNIPKDHEEWSTLLAEASANPVNLIPSPLLERPWLLSLWMILCPQRALPEAINHCYSTFKDTVSLNAAK